MLNPLRRADQPGFGAPACAASGCIPIMSTKKLPSQPVASTVTVSARISLFGGVFRVRPGDRESR